MLKAIFNNHEQEAKTFEERTGLSGISREYSLPRGLTPEKLAKCLKSPMFNVLFDNFSHNVKLLTQQFSERSDLSPAEKLNSWHKLSLAELLKEIIELNPELKDNNYYEDRSDIRCFLMGIASGYNKEDIQYTLDAFRYSPDYKAYMQEIRYIQNDIHQRTGHFPEWTVSPETHTLILEQIEHQKPE